MITRHYMIVQYATALRERRVSLGSEKARLGEIASHWGNFPFWEQCLIRAIAKAQVDGEVSR